MRGLIRGGQYHIGLQLIAFTVIAPYMSISRWKEDFVPPALHRPVAPAWYVGPAGSAGRCAHGVRHLRFSGFQVVSSYTNTGMSLVDTSMVPFQQAYPMIVFMIILILAGNTAFVRHTAHTWSSLLNLLSLQPIL